MKLFKRSVRNVLHHPFRLILVVLLLGMSLMFVAAMANLNTNAQQALATVHQQLGTGITIRSATDSGPSSPQGNNATPTGTQGGGPIPGTPTTGGQSSGPIPGSPTTSNPTPTPTMSNPIATPPAGSDQPGGLTIAAPTPIPNSVVQQARGIPGVASVEEFLARPDGDGVLTGTSANGPNGVVDNITISIHALSPGANHQILSEGSIPTFVAGRIIQDSDANAPVAMMSQALAQINHLKLGSTFSIKGQTFTLIGLYTVTDQFAASSIVIPLAMMQQVFGIDGVDSITAYATSYEQVGAVADRLGQALGQQYTIKTDSTQYNGVFIAIGATQKAIQLALFVAIGISVIVTIFAVLMLIRERTAEIAILKTIGASHVQVLRQFWTEIVTLSLLAAALAALLLALLGPLVSQKFDFTLPVVTTGTFVSIRDNSVTVRTPTDQAISAIHLAVASLNIQSFLLILALGIGLALLTSLIPTWFVSHIKPAEVLRKAS